jgi:hypothetical protein
MYTVQTQTRAAYCRILPTLDQPRLRYFSGSSDTNQGSLVVEYYQLTLDYHV